MRGIASQVLVSSLLSGKSELGESSKAALLLIASVWIFASWDYRRLHTSNTTISSAIRTTSTTSALTRTYRGHPRSSTLIITRETNRTLLFYGNKLGHWLVENLATRTTRECGINRRTRHHNWNIGRTLWRGLLRNARLSIRFKVRCVIRRFIGILKLGFGSIDLKRMTSEISFTRNFRANHLGSNLRPGAEAQFVHHAVQTSRQ